MVILTKLIISNIKNIKANYIFFEFDFDFLFEDDNIYKTDFDNDFIQKIINVYENNKIDENLDESSLDEIFGKFLKKLKNYLNHLLKIENDIIDLNTFYKDEYIICPNELFYKLDNDNKLYSNMFESAWY